MADNIITAVIDHNRRKNREEEDVYRFDSAIPSNTGPDPGQVHLNHMSVSGKKSGTVILPWGLGVHSDLSGAAHGPRRTILMTRAEKPFNLWQKRSYEPPIRAYVRGTTALITLVLLTLSLFTLSPRAPIGITSTLYGLTVVSRAFLNLITAPRRLPKVGSRLNSIL